MLMLSMLAHVRQTLVHLMAEKYMMLPLSHIMLSGNICGKQIYEQIAFSETIKLLLTYLLGDHIFRV